MADLQIGNQLGIAAAGGATLLAQVVADGVADNTVTITNYEDNLEIGMVIDIRNMTTGSATGGATSRTIIAIDDENNLITYDGADVDPTNAFGLYLAGQWRPNIVNINGGASPRAGLDWNETDTIQSMRTFLQDFESTTYSNAQLNHMTYNDLVYACRMAKLQTSRDTFGATPALNAYMD